MVSTGSGYSLFVCCPGSSSSHCGHGSSGRFQWDSQEYPSTPSCHTREVEVVEDPIPRAEGDRATVVVGVEVRHVVELVEQEVHGLELIPVHEVGDPVELAVDGEEHVVVEVVILLVSGHVENETEDPKHVEQEVHGLELVPDQVVADTGQLVVDGEENGIEGVVVLLVNRHVEDDAGGLELVPVQVELAKEGVVHPHVHVGVVLVVVVVVPGLHSKVLGEGVSRMLSERAPCQS